MNMQQSLLQFAGMAARTSWGRAAGRYACRGWADTCYAPGYFYQVMERCGPSLAEPHRLRRRLPDGSSVDCDLRDHVQRHIYFLGAYEPIEAYLFWRLARPGMTVVDAGANVGQYTLLAARRVGPGGRVHSFEPVPGTFARLEDHLRDNRLDNVHANRSALWHEAAELRLGLDVGSEGNAGAYSVGAAAADVVAPAVAFDLYAEQRAIDRVDLVKMDIEGAEWHALQGMRETLRRDRPILLMEVNREACESVGYDPGEFWKLLCDALGYEAWAVGGSAADWRRLDSADGVDRVNVIFAPDRLPDEVSTGWTTKGCLKWACRPLEGA